MSVPLIRTRRAIKAGRKWLNRLLPTMFAVSIKKGFIDMNIEGDIVLIYYKDQPGVYGRIEKIEPDIKKDWYQVTLMLFTIPHQVVTWILREEYINGDEFTMGGNSMRMEKMERLSFDDEKPEGRAVDQDNSKSKNVKTGKVLTFKRKKRS